MSHVACCQMGPPAGGAGAPPGSRSKIDAGRSEGSAASVPLSWQCVWACACRVLSCYRVLRAHIQPPPPARQQPAEHVATRPPAPSPAHRPKYKTQLDGDTKVRNHRDAELPPFLLGVATRGRPKGDVDSSKRERSWPRPRCRPRLDGGTTRCTVGRKCRCSPLLLLQSYAAAHTPLPRARRYLVPRQRRVARRGDGEAEQQEGVGRVGRFAHHRAGPAARQQDVGHRRECASAAHRQAVPRAMA
eukprot:scaffold13663_cov120-Isochrysis_galbana.AAC.4